MSFGGGFFGGGETTSNSKTDTNNYETGQQAGGSAFNLNLGTTSASKKGKVDQDFNFVMTDFGAVGGALDFASGAVSGVMDLAFDVFSGGNTNSLEVVRAGENIAGIGSDMAIRIAEQSAQQTADAMSFSANQIASNRGFLENIFGDSSDLVSNAYSTANASMVNFMDATFGRVADLQENSIESLNQNSQAAQSASLKALDYVFESTKSGDERIADTTVKWAMAAVALVALMPVFGKMIK